MSNRNIYKVLPSAKLDKHLLLVIILSLFVFSCSTSKNRFLNRAYHSINTKYNGYFNARESYNNALKTLENAHLDNYEEVLSIFRYGSSQNRSSVSANMDIAYEKCSRVIRKHSMNIQGVEHNRYIDDAYYLIARSHFFKEDYNLSIIMFEYIIRQYDTPLKYKSKIWIAKCRHQLGHYEQAGQVLEAVQKDKEEGLLNRRTERLYNLVRADHYIRMNEYKEAARYLSRGINLTRNRSERTRLTFILGQVYYRAEDYYSAQRAYARVLRMNPDFDMAFRARINMATSYDPRSGDVKAIKEELEKMLRSERNREYRDEIYYAMGMLELRQDNQAKAIEYLLESTKVSDRNRFQKGLSFLRLGELHFEMPEYLKASIYYDSVVVFLSSDYDGFDKIHQRQRTLFDLARQIRIIQREDSLQRLAGMSLADRNKVVDGIISALREEERLERERERERQQQMQQFRGRGMSRDAQGGSGAGWYFYNTSAISFGKTEFYAKWGDRPLEDLWRISNKQLMTFGFDFEDQEEMEEEEPQDKFNRDTYLANIPTTAEMMQESNDKLAKAYYNKGIILKNRLIDNERAVNSFDVLVNRFPEFDEKLQVYYYLYTLYNSIGEFYNAEIYKNRIIEEYPDSDFANILKDPNFAENIRNRKNFSQDLYKRSYYAFLSKDYNSVINNFAVIDTVEVERPLKAKFTLLAAMSHGNNDEHEKMRRNLENIVVNYDDTPAFETARDLLAILTEREMLAIVKDVGDDREKAEFISRYKYDPDAIHFFALVIDSRRMQLREVRNKINQYNRDNHADANLSISNIFLNERQQLITITNFKGAEKAMEYYGNLFSNEVLDGYDTTLYYAFLISVENYPIFYQEKNIEEYLEFYMHYYFK